VLPSIVVIGAYPVVGAREPVHLVEVTLGGFPDFDFGEVTQSIAGKPRSEWQVAYDERVLGSVEAGVTRAVFFFHYLDFTNTLETPAGSLELPSPSEMPAEFRTIEYEPP
jgi:hypothetical protein